MALAGNWACGRALVALSPNPGPCRAGRIQVNMPVSFFGFGVDGLIGLGGSAHPATACVACDLPYRGAAAKFRAAFHRRVIFTHPPRSGFVAERSGPRVDAG